MIKPVLVLWTLLCTVVSSVAYATDIDEKISSAVAFEAEVLSAISTRPKAARSWTVPDSALRPIVRPDKPFMVYDRDWLRQQPVATGGPEWKCLTEALYFEARGETIKGISAVAEVILNRTTHPRFPSTVCGVVHQGTGRKYACQFTYTCDGLPEKISEPRAYEMVGKIARKMLDGAPRPLTNGATHYHTTAVNPRWAKVYPRTARIGDHRFYRKPT